MDSKPIYRISLSVSMTLSILFMLLLATGLFTSGKIEVFDILMFATFFFALSILIVFDLICYRVNRHNKERTQIPASLRTAGNIVFALSILSILYVFFCAIASLISLQNMDRKVAAMNVIYIFIVILFFMLGVASIINSVHFIKTSRKNKGILNDLIDDIGEEIIPSS